MKKTQSIRRGKSKGIAIQRIMDAALDIFGSTYYDKVSLRHIARQAQVAPATVYDYFADKRELMLAVVTVKLKELSGLLESDIKCGKNPEEQINKMTLSVLHFFVDNISFARLLYYGLPMLAWYRSEAWEEARRQRHLFTSVITNSQKHNYFRPDLDLDLVNTLYWGGIRRLMTKLLISKDVSFDLGKTALAYSDLILHAIATPNT